MASCCCNVSGEGDFEFGEQAVHDAPLDPPAPTRSLPATQAVHDASPDPPLPTRYLPATQSGGSVREWESAEEIASLQWRLAVF